MKSIKNDERGFSTVELGLIVVIVALVGFVGWSVYHTQQNSNKALDAATKTNQNAGPNFADNSKNSPAATGDTSNATLQKDLASATSSSSQGSQELSSANDSLSDQSTLTTVPQ